MPLKKGPKKAEIILEKIKVSLKKALTQLGSLGGISKGNSIKIFHDGDCAFDAIIHELNKAKSTIYLEVYIFKEDKVGKIIAQALIEASKRGVDVNLIYDHFGSSGLSNKFLHSLNNSGVKILPFNPIWPWRRKGPLLFRDHRKIIVIDEKVAFCGGMNIGEEYAGQKYGNGFFRDSMAKVSGPAVNDLLDITKETILESTFQESPEKFIQKKQIEFSDIELNNLFRHKKLLSDESVSDSAVVQVLRSNSRRNLMHIQRSMEEVLDRAHTYCYFTTPYFLPYKKLRKAIINAARRGVDVRILTAGLSDIPLMRYAGHHVYQAFLKEGIRIYEMEDKVLHAKLATVDGIYSSIGSYNFDNWSGRRNLEVNLSIIDNRIAIHLKKQFISDLSFSVEVDPKKINTRNILVKFFCWLAYKFFSM